MDGGKLIKIEKSPGRFDIILNNPPVNIMNIDMMTQICDALEEAGFDRSLKVVVYRAEGRFFDLDEFAIIHKLLPCILDLSNFLSL